MDIRKDVRERAMELAFLHRDVSVVERKLAEEGLGGFLDETELEMIVVEAKSIRGMLPERPGRTLPRVVGMIAVIAGVAGIWLGTDGPVRGRNSPGGYGVVAVVLGVVLLVAPSLGRSDIGR